MDNPKPGSLGHERCGLGRLYGIADADTWNADELPELVALWSGLGVRCVQLRAKGASELELLALAKKCSERLAGTDTKFWINDSVLVARDVQATGVHLGQSDLAPEIARAMLEEGQLIGRSTHGLAQAHEANGDPAVDVIAVGPVFTTRSKRDPDPEVGIESLAEICSAVAKPVIAIGGIGEANCLEVLRAGVASVAMIGALKGPIEVERLVALCGGQVGR